MDQKYIISERNLVNIADAIREKSRKVADLSVNDMANEILDIPVGLDTRDATARPGDILTGETAYVNNVKLIGTMPIIEQEVSNISVSSKGVITATSISEAGYNPGATVSGTKQLSTQAARTVTPSTITQTVCASGMYTTGAIKVADIPSEYINTSDATATAEDIASGKTAYVNGQKITGTSSGGSETGLETYILTYFSDAPMLGIEQIYYIDQSLQLRQETLPSFMEQKQFFILKNSIFAFINVSLMDDEFDGLTIIENVQDLNTETSLKLCRIIDNVTIG